MDDKPGIPDQLANACGGDVTVITPKKISGGDSSNRRRFPLFP
jgi:hypothetical protein